MGMFLSKGPRTTRPEAALAARMIVAPSCAGLASGQISVLATGRLSGLTRRGHKPHARQAVK